MSCYLPLVHRWKNKDHSSLSSNEPSARERGGRGEGGLEEHGEQQERTDCSHVLALRDRKGVTLSQGYGDFPQQVFLNIRHDHPTLGLSDVAYQRLHQEHTHRTHRTTSAHSAHRTTRTARTQDDDVDVDGDQHQQAGVVSLGLPLGISSLKLTHRHRRKQKTANNGPDGDNHGGQMKSDLYQKLSKSSHNLAEGASFHNANTHQEERHYHAGRKSSLPRKAKIPSSYQYQPRPHSVDADLLMQSAEKSRATGAGGAEEAVITAKFFVPGEDRASSEDVLRFAHLTSPRSFMASQEVDKSSSGNSSGSELTSEEYQPHHQPHHQHHHQHHQHHQHPAIRGRAAVNLNNLLANRGPPPRHLLPAKLRPSPATKLHPYVSLPRHVLSAVSGLSGMRSPGLVSPSIT